MDYIVQIKQLNGIKLESIENEVNNALKELFNNNTDEVAITIHNIDIKYINDHVSIFAEIMIVYSIETVIKQKQTLYS